MIGWKEYFELVAGLLGIYAVLRAGIWWQFGQYFKRFPSGKRMVCDGHPIETSPLTERLREVRQDYSAEAHAHRPLFFKRSLLLESKREEIAKLAFFQKPPPVLEPPDHEHPSLLLAL